MNLYILPALGAWPRMFVWLLSFFFVLGGRALRQFDFRAARVALVASVPGTGKKKHRGRDSHRYGHMRVRALLSREKESGTIARLEKGGHKLVFQVSSLASRSPDPTSWLYELLESFMPGEDETKGGSSLAAQAKADLLGDRLRVLWPSVDAVRASSKGWISGGCVYVCVLNAVDMCVCVCVCTSLVEW